MRTILILATAATTALPSSAAAQGILGEVLGEVADELENAMEASASDTGEASVPGGDPGAAFGSGAYTQSWDSMRPVRFEHVIEGPPGPVTLLLDGRTLDGNQTVSVYRVDRYGVRVPGWRMFVITTREGNRAAGTLTLPRPPEGETIARQPVVIVVENHSGRRSQGEFALRVIPEEGQGR